VDQTTGLPTLRPVMRGRHPYSDILRVPNKGF
jgi:hypothetical protein